MSFISDITVDAEVIAKKVAPKDTLNLVLNGISKRVTEDVGEINYDNVFYIEYLEEGTKNYEGAQGFIANDTVNEIKALIYARANNQFDQDSFANTKQEVSQYKPTVRTNARYLQSIGGESLVSE